VKKFLYGNEPHVPTKSIDYNSENNWIKIRYMVCDQHSRPAAWNVFSSYDPKSYRRSHIKSEASCNGRIQRFAVRHGLPQVTPNML
jgi:hypothetical protein